jgi:RNA polymerase sigma-70 factor (ECF subfamily)
VPPAPSDEIALLRRQDPAAFERLVKRCQGIVLGIGQTLGLHGANLDDGAAEAFAEVYRSLPRFEARAELTTWVYRIAYRAMLHARKRNKPQGSGEVDQQLADTRVEPPVNSAERKEEFEKLWAAVGRLDETQAMAVELFYRRQMSVEEVAAVMECPVGTVKTNLFRAREALRKMLEKK